MNACRNRSLMVLSVYALLACLVITTQFGLGVSSAAGRKGFAHAPLHDQTATPALRPTANSSSEIQPVSQLQGGFSTSVISGTLAYMGEGKALTILDVSTTQQPVRRTSLPLPEAAVDIAVEKTTLYILGSTALYLFDVSTPDAPVSLSTFSLSSFVNHIRVVNNLVYLAGGMFQVIDVHNPAAPTSLGQIDLRQDVRDFQVVDGRAYVAGSGFQIIDVSNPASLSLLGGIANQISNQVQVVNTLAYLSESAGKLLIFNVSDPTSLTLSGVYVSGAIFTNLVIPQSSMFGYGIVVGPSYNPTSELQVFDLADPLHPTLRSRISVQASTFRLQVLGTKISVSNNDRLTLISTANPDAPSFLGAFATLIDPSAVQVVGGTAYITTNPGGLVIADVSDPARPRLRGGYALPKNASRLQVVGNLAYVAGGYYGGLQIIDISDADHPHWIGSYSTLGSVQDVQVVDKLAYIADYNGGLVVVDVSDPTHPTLRRPFTIPDYPFISIVRVSGNTAYVIGSTGEYDQNSLITIDIHDPAAPTLLGSYNLEQYPSYLQVGENRAYLSSYNEIRILDTKDPSAPMLRGVYSTNDRILGFNAVEIQNKLAYVSASNSSFQVVDLTNPSKPYLRALFSVSEIPIFSQVVEDLAFVATHDGGLQILRLPEGIKQVRIYLPNVIQSGENPLT